MPATHRPHDQCRRQVGRQHHVHKAVRKGRIENHLKPVLDDKLTDCIHLVTSWRLHPAVDGQNPESRKSSTKGHHERGQEMQLGAHALTPKQHDAQKTRLQKKRGHHLITHEGPDHRSCLVSEHAPIGAELIAHHHARDHAHTEGHGKYFFPVIEQRQVDRIVSLEMQKVENGQVAGQPDGKRGKNNVKTDGERKLQPGQRQGIEPFHTDLRGRTIRQV